jgi:hypothetical protein
MVQKSVRGAVSEVLEVVERIRAALAPKPVVDAFALASIRSPLAEAQAAVEQAESVVAQLEAKRAACVKRGTELRTNGLRPHLRHTLATPRRRSGLAKSIPRWRLKAASWRASMQPSRAPASTMPLHRRPRREKSTASGAANRDLLAQSPSKMGGPAQRLYSAVIRGPGAS